MASPPNTTLWVTAVVAALAVIVVVASVMPRFTTGEETNWIVSILAGVVVGAAVLAYGFTRRNTGTTERTTPPERR